MRASGLGGLALSALGGTEALGPARPPGRPRSQHLVGSSSSPGADLFPGDQMALQTWPPRGPCRPGLAEVGVQKEGPVDFTESEPALYPCATAEIPGFLENPEIAEILSFDTSNWQTHQILRSGLEMPQASGGTSSLWSSSCGWWVPIRVAC